MARHFKHLLLVPCLLLAVSCGRKERGAPDFGGTVTGLIGDALILKAGASGWDTLEYKAEVGNGDSLRTLPESQAEITFNGDNTLRIDENTGVRIRRTEDSAGAPLIDVFTGKGTVLSNIVKLAGGNNRYQVSTPTSTAAIRGTYFMVFFDTEIRVCDVHCLEGRVWVANPARRAAGAVIVMPGFFTSVGFGVFPVAPAHIPPGQWKKFHGIMPPSLFIHYTGQFKVRGLEDLLRSPRGQDMHGRHLRLKTGGGHSAGPAKGPFRNFSFKGKGGKGGGNFLPWGGKRDAPAQPSGQGKKGGKRKGK